MLFDEIIVARVARFGRGTRSLKYVFMHLDMKIHNLYMMPGYGQRQHPQPILAL